MTDLDALLRQLPDDPRPDSEVNADLEVAIERALAQLLDRDDAVDWAYQYRAYLVPSRVLRHFPEQQRLAFTIHAWRIGYLLGLDAARCPAPIQLDLSQPFGLREATLLWVRFTLDPDPWADFDLRPLRTSGLPTIDPIGRALWRLATGSGRWQLSEEHRAALADVRREPPGFASLVVEEAREIDTRGVDALRLVTLLLQDPVLQHRHGDDALAVLGRAYLYRARAHQRLAQLDEAWSSLDRWRGLDGHVRMPSEQRLLAGEIRARIEMDEDQLVVAGDRLARLALAFDDAPPVRERQVEVFTALGELHARARRYDDADSMLMKALHWLRGDASECPGGQHVRVVEHLATARWHRFLGEIRPHLFDADPLGDPVFDIIEAHRAPFRDLRANLEASAADLVYGGLGLDDALSLLLYRWQIARSLVIDDPHAMIERLVAVGLAVAERTSAFLLVDVAFDLLFPLRLAGWRLGQVIDAEPLARLYAIEPDARRVVEAIVHQRVNGSPAITLAAALSPDSDGATVH